MKAINCLGITLVMLLSMTTSYAANGNYIKEQTGTARAVNQSTLLSINGQTHIKAGEYYTYEAIFSDGVPEGTFWGISPTYHTEINYTSDGRYATIWLDPSIYKSGMSFIIICVYPVDNWNREVELQIFID